VLCGALARRRAIALADLNLPEAILYTPIVQRRFRKHFCDGCSERRGFTRRRAGQRGRASSRTVGRQAGTQACPGLPHVSG
jgi:hypothetical protein